MVNRDPSVRVYGSGHSKAEDIFCGLEWGDDLELSEERLFLLESSLKANRRDFLSG